MISHMVKHYRIGCLRTTILTFNNKLYNNKNFNNKLYIPRVLHMPQRNIKDENGLGLNPLNLAAFQNGILMHLNMIISADLSHLRYFVETCERQ